MTDSHRTDVAAFFDTHPINEEEILAKLRQAGRNVDTLQQADLGELDQDHYGGTAAVAALAAAAGITRDSRVLDVCSGMGGPARWLAAHIGCHVTGVDLTPSRVEGARRLAQRVGLQDRVTFVQGDATAMPFQAAQFDAVISQEAWCYIPDKMALLGECARVLRKRGAIAFTDILALGLLSDDDQRRLLAGMQIPAPVRAHHYQAVLGALDFRIEQSVDLSAEWSRILVQRLAMYRSLRDTTVARFGEARYQEYDAAYAHFVGLFTDGKLGGYRFAARRP